MTKLSYIRGATLAIWLMLRQSLCVWTMMSVLWTMVAVTKCATICQEVMSAPACLATIMMLIILARILMSA